MDRRIGVLYNDRILKEAAVRFDIDFPTLKKLGGFESFIYEYGPDDSRKILRIAHSYHRNMDDLHAEMDFAEFFLSNFMDGYCMENILAPKWMNMLPEFLKLREIILYVAISRSLDPVNPDKWCIKYINEHRTTIENDVPILDREII